ncbi:MAG TPA: hypothetical protein VGJ84_07565 [Polyangiaceae bacterium]|jgi:acyl-CoA thioester hydrolase
MQQISNQSGELCCEAVLVIALFDVRARKLIAPTPEWLRAIGVSELPDALADGAPSTAD